MNPRWIINGTIYIVILAAVVVGLFLWLNRDTTESEEVALSEIIALAAEPENPPLKIEISGSTVTATDGEDPNATVYTSTIGDNSRTDLYQILLDSGIAAENYTFSERPSGGLSRFFSIFLAIVPLLLILAFLIYILRRASNSNNQTFGFGRSKAKVFVGSKANVTFYDVAGVPEAKEELAEVVDFLRYPERFQVLGARIPKGVLMVGPPGTGKTLLARAVAGEAGVPFFSISGSEFVEMFVGVGASRVRDLFEQAKNHSPCIVFVDEIDAVGRHRGAGLGGGHDEREQTLNQMLVEMDGFDTSTNVIVVAATNRPDILDPALLRPGRFDRRVILDTPDVQGRKAIMEVHAKGKPFDVGVDMEIIARQTSGFTGADLANLINEAALLAGRARKTSIGTDELTEAIDRVSIGPARKSRVLSSEERAMVTHHEAGHAIVSHFVPDGKPVGKISIIARGHAGGFTRYQQDDHSLQSQTELEAMIASAMGGRAAEYLQFGKVTTGAAHDIEQATKLARNMVTRLGMSTRLGPRQFGKREEAIFLGKEMSEQRDYSLKSEVAIDAEIDRLLSDGEKRATEILTERQEQVKNLTEFLFQHETVEAEQFIDIMEGREPVIAAPSPPQPDDSTVPTKATPKDASLPKPIKVNPEPQTF